MPRKPRLDHPGILHHIIARGIEKRNIFNDNLDRDFFVERLGEILTDTSTICYAFALIPNHFHLLLSSGRYPIAKVMSRLLTAHAIRYNTKYKRVGHLFQNRYKDIICQEEIYLLELIRYIHLNAIRANIVGSISELNEFQYSSHKYLLNENDAPSWFYRDNVLSLFNPKEKKAIKIYNKFLEDGLNMGKNNKLSGGGLRENIDFSKGVPKQKIVHDDRILGESDFVIQILEKMERKKNQKINKQYRDIEEIAKKVCNLYDLNKDELIGKGRKRIISNARALISYLATKDLGLSASEVGQYLELNCSSVIRSVVKGKELAEQNGLNV